VENEQGWSIQMASHGPNHLAVEAVTEAPGVPGLSTQTTDATNVGSVVTMHMIALASVAMEEEAAVGEATQGVTLAAAAGAQGEETAGPDPQLADLVLLLATNCRSLATQRFTNSRSNSLQELLCYIVKIKFHKP